MPLTTHFRDELPDAVAREFDQLYTTLQVKFADADPAPAPVAGATADIYTPTIIGGTNVTNARVYPCYYLRINNVVHVAGQVDITTADNALATFYVSLPFPTTFAALHMLAGVFTCQVAGVIQVGRIAANTSNHRAEFSWRPNESGVHGLFFNFTYRLA